ncbi:DUF2155 domain-containing protein [Shimia abyssi]|uniref:DUF2155 domain-containing protein n=1 Tax=Shimia abyssi TaxID=1662395 RepID=A0A2P8FD27_9RHOB|nr:DUF2155 domain-containing protein [Shimia abyssi]PSL19636.1 hypothetical protein CLV88_10558 [Shimia abyssi]
MRLGAGVIAGAILLSAPVLAQEIIVETLEIEPQTFEPLQQTLGDVTSESVTAAKIALGAQLRGLDKLTGDLVDFDLENGFSVNFGALRVDMAQCRYPEDNATGEAFAYLTIWEDNGAGAVAFEGWMVASSPALSALDHARYDVWVLRCSTSGADGSE